MRDFLLKDLSILGRYGLNETKPTNFLSGRTLSGFVSRPIVCSSPRTLSSSVMAPMSDRYVSRLMRLAWLAPDVLERLVVHREPSTISIYDLCFVASLPWEEQPGRVFDPD